MIYQLTQSIFHTEEGPELFFKAQDMTTNCKRSPLMDTSIDPEVYRCMESTAVLKEIPLLQLVVKSICIVLY